MLRGLTLAGLLCLSLSAQAPAPAATPAPARLAPPTLPDHNLLDATYFGIDAALMKETDGGDYFWAKPGFSFKGRTLRVTWEEPHLMTPNDDKLDLATAARLSKALPEAFAKALATSLWPAAKVSTTEGDLVLTGRIVSVLARSGFFSRAPELLTFDLKVLDASTQEVLLACHHRLGAYRFTLGGKGKDLDLRIPPYAQQLSEYCRAHYTD